MGISITEERIDAIYSMGEYFSLMVAEKMYEAKSIIVATGVEYVKPVKGEEEFLGKGVGYCATCDAQLYKDRVVTIIGHNKHAEEEANYVSELASKTYYVPMYKGNYELNDNISVIQDKLKEIVGDEKVKEVVFEKQRIQTDGVFLLKDSISPSQLVPGLEMDNEHIKVDRKMETNIKNCYAAGDCTGKPYQYMKAAGEGQVAALSAVEAISQISQK